MRARLNTPGKRIACVTVIMAFLWGAMIVSQGLRGACHSADWSLMSEVGRRVSVGDTLYVEAMDQKGPLCYATYAIAWLIMRTQLGTYVFSNIAIWLLLTISSGIAALMVEEGRKPWCHILTQALIVGVIFVPHVGCVEQWLVPFGMLGALWVRRLARGRRVPDYCWVILGLAATYALWVKFTCCAQFVFLACYAISREQTKGVRRALCIAGASCILSSIVVIVWLWLAGSWGGTLEFYLLAASDGYAGRMSMLQHIANGNPSTTHLTSFVVGLPLAVWAIAMIARTARRRIPVILGGIAYIVCCFATFVGYYRFQLAPLVVLGACELYGAPWRLPVLSWLDEHLGRARIIAVLSLIGIAAATNYTCKGTTNMMNKSTELISTLHRTIGDENSVLVWQFDHTWVYGELGLECYYPMPARYNASQDLWDYTAGIDLETGKWRYVVVSIREGNLDVGDYASVGDGSYPVIAVAANMAILDGEATQSPLTNQPYRTP